MLAAATWRALRKALFPHQRTELRKGKILQRLSHLEWFGVAIQLLRKPITFGAPGA